MIACLSPNGGISYELTEAPTEILVGTAAGVAILRRSDEHSPWRAAGLTLEGRHIGALLSLPDGSIFAGCHASGGLHRSRDGGLTWTNVGSEITGSDIYSLAAIDTPEGLSIVAGMGPATIYRSDDLGDSWQEYPSLANVPGAEEWTFPPPPHVPHVKSMTVNPERGNSLYACVEQGALLRTDDGGVSWTELSGMWSLDDEAYHDAHRLIVAPWDPDLFLLSTGLGMYRSEDHGRSWTRIGGLDPFIRYPDSMVASPHDRAIFVSGPLDTPRDWLSGNACGHVCRSLDGGLTWDLVDHEMGSGRTANIEALSIISYPSGYMLLVADTDGNIFAGSDQGTDWRKIAITAAVSKGGHHKILEVAKKLPRPLAGLGATLMRLVIRLSSTRAGKKRKAAFARRQTAAG